MENYEIARALTDLSDELLLEAKHPEGKRRPLGLGRLAAVAAVVAALALTVGAAALGITWSIRQTRHEGTGFAQGYYKDDDGVLEGEVLEYQIPLTRVELSRDAMNRLRDILWRYWNLARTADYIEIWDRKPEGAFVYDSSDVDLYMQTYLGRYNPTQSVEPSYGDLEQIEALLDLTLDVSPELREAARTTKQGISLRLLTDLTMEEVSRNIEAKIFPEPICIVISFDLQGYAGNGQVSGMIVLPLTEERAQKGISGSFYSYEKEGTIWQTTENLGGQEICFFGNTPELGYEGFCKAIYATEQGGYMLRADIESPDPGRSFPKPVFDSAKDMLLPLLENVR